MSDDARLAEALRLWEEGEPGEAPVHDAARIDALCARFPEVAGELRDALSMALSLERAGSAQLPAQISRYELRGLLGAGGMAEVHLAFDPALQRELALKLVRFEGAEAEALRSRFLREARAQARLSHPHVLAVLDAGEQDGFAWLCCERMQGHLADAGRGSELVEDEGRRRLLRRIAEAARGLDAAHRAGLVHRDVKPTNLLLGEDGHVRVADFGLARGAGDPTLTRTGEALGTLSFAAPEQLRGEEATPASDVYALGATLYHLWTGALPSPGLPPAVPQDLPPEARRLLGEALRLEPEARPTMQDLAAGLGATETVTPPRHGALLFIAGLLALAVVAAVLWTQPPPSPPPAPAPKAKTSPSARVIFRGSAEALLADRIMGARLRAAQVDAQQLSTPAEGEQVRFHEGSGLFRTSIGKHRLSVFVRLHSGGAEADLARWPLDPPAFRRLSSWKLMAPAVDIDGDTLPETVIGDGSELAVLKWDLGIWSQPVRTGLAQRAFERRMDARFSYGGLLLQAGGGAPLVWAADVGDALRTGEHTRDSRLYALTLSGGKLRASHPLLGAVRSAPVPAPGGAVFIDTQGPGNHIAPAKLFVADARKATQLALPPALAGRITAPLRLPETTPEGCELLIAAINGQVLCAARRGDALHSVWSHEVGGFLIAPPRLRELDGEAVACFGAQARMVCLRLRGPAQERVALDIAAEGGSYVVHTPVSAPDLDGDGQGELLTGGGNGTLHAFSLGAGQALWAHAGDHGPVRGIATLPEPEAQAVVLHHHGRLQALTLGAEGATPRWHFEAGDAVMAAPVAVTLADGRSAVLLASYDGWLYLLRAPDPPQTEPSVVWSFRAAGGIGATPLVARDGARHYALFTDHSGRIYKAPLPSLR